MKYFAIALMLLHPLAADAQHPNRARAYVQKVLARTNGDSGKAEQSKPRSARAEALGRSGDEVRMPAGWNTPARKQHGDAKDADRWRGDRDGWHGDHDRWPQTHRPGWRPDRFQTRRPFGSYYAVPFTGYGWGFYPSGPGPAESEAPPPPVEERTTTTMTRGVLRLEITPASGLDYYIDGVFIGNSSTIGSDIELNAGPRRVEVRAAGYKPLVFDVRIAVGRETVFRATMEPLVQPQAPQAGGNRTMYIIPGCYVGNAQPSPSGLRPGCDIKNLITK